MLVYIRKDLIKNILVNVEESDIPHRIKEAIIAFKEAKTKTTFKLHTFQSLLADERRRRIEAALNELKQIEEMINFMEKK